MWRAGMVLRHIAACLVQMVVRRVHDPEFGFLSQLADEPGLVLDVGANHGHSAISILVQTRKIRVYSLEPIRWLAVCLALVRLRYRRRFDFRMVAADRVTGEAFLSVPLGAGGRLSAWSSLEPREFEKDYLRETLDRASNRKWSLKRQRVRTVRIDDLGLNPDLVKIDVEGAEARALAGMQETLAHRRPALMIEINNTHEWLPGLEQAGYVAWCYDPETGFRRYVPEDPQINLILLHPESRCRLSRAISALTRLQPPAEHR